MTTPYSAGDWIPNTDADVREMLAKIGEASVDDLFKTVPPDLFAKQMDLPDPLSEMEVVDHLSALAARNLDIAGGPTFAGGGIYDHFVPAIVRALASRGEFATAYTPYQAEASQGTLQYLFEFQTMIAELFGLAASNASLYDAATGVVEGVNLTGGNKVVVCEGVNPRYTRVLQTYAAGLGLDIQIAKAVDGATPPESLEHAEVIVVQQPNVWGYFEDVDGIRAAAPDAKIVAACDPISLGVLKPPGEWGAQIAVAEGQALGNPTAFGGQCVGLFACDKSYVRKMPGRLVGETVDTEGRRGFVLTLQAREQHIKRAKAGSNICTNQSLFALMVTLQLSWLGPGGLERIAQISSAHAHNAAEKIQEETNFRLSSTRPFLREFTIVHADKDAAHVKAELRSHGIASGPATNHGLTLAFTERRTNAHIDALTQALKLIGK